MIVNSVYCYQVLRSSMKAHHKAHSGRWFPSLANQGQIMKHIHRYYSPNDLYNSIIEGLDGIGKELSEVTLDDLQPVDEFHIRGSAATNELIKLSRFTPDMHVIDVGCGIGSSTRRLSIVIGKLHTHLHAGQDIARTKLVEDRYISSVPAIGNGHSAAMTVVLGGIKGVPASTHIGLKPGVQIHRRKPVKIAHHQARGDADTATQGDAKVRHITAYTFTACI